jgi:hypothetical protein
MRWDTSVLLLIYVVSSCIMMPINGYLMTSLPISMPGLVLFWQNGLTTVAVILYKRWDSLATVVRNAGGVLVAAAVCVAFVSVLFTGLLPLRSVSVESMVVCRSVGTIGIALAEFLLFRQRQSLLSMASLVVVVFGAWLYADLQATSISLLNLALMWLVMNNVAVAVYSVVVRAALTRSGVDSQALGCTNNLLSLVLLLPFMAMEALSLSRLPQISISFPVFAALALSGVLGCAISITALAVRARMSATAFSMVANGNKIGTIGISSYFRHTSLSLHAHLGILVALLGTAAYGYAQQSARSPTPEHVQLLPDETDPESACPASTAS